MEKIINELEAIGEKILEKSKNQCKRDFDKSMANYRRVRNAILKLKDMRKLCETDEPNTSTQKPESSTTSKK